MRAFVVIVDYWDLAGICLTYNRHHFSELNIITSEEDCRKYGAIILGKRYQANIYATDAFTRNGAVFNKWLALEEGLDFFGRHGWICLMDADVLWPRSVEVRTELEDGCLHLEGGNYHERFKIRPGQLCSPLRCMWDNWPSMPEWFDSLIIPNSWGRTKEGNVIPCEETWKQFPIHRNIMEWAGYTQIFHASDPVLGQHPWHETNYTHAGAADSWFQQKWKQEDKVRPSFEVLHLGQAGQNWMGRVTPYADGSIPERLAEKREAIKRMWQTRTLRRQAGLDPFEEEKTKK